jgi:DNA polymerase III subunit epsilon
MDSLIRGNDRQLHYFTKHFSITLLMDLPENLTFVDIETTGGSINFDRIIEIGILQVKNNKLEKTFETFLNPDRSLPPEITNLTGIQASDLEKAPSFFDIKDELMGYFEDTVFVAHNARFDYGFLKQEFLRYGDRFSQKQLCTVKLSRLLYPEHRHHNLDSIIERFQFEIKNRHRAFSDAKILWDFYQKIQSLFPAEKLVQTISHILKKPNIPPKLKNFTHSDLPETPGVYIFYGENGQPLYVGKSKNIRDRVLSHFTLSTGDSSEMKIYNTIESMEFIKTAGELGALLKESEMIKKLMPLYNRRLRYREKMVTAVKKEVDGIFTVEIEETGNPDINNLENIMAVFKNKRQAKETLTLLAKDHNLCDKFLGLQKTKGACFNSQLGRCNGICAGKENDMKYNLRFIEAFLKTKIKSWPYPGPVTIKEISPEDGREELFLIHNWCIVQKQEGDNELPDESSFSESKNKNLENLVFDYDVYKILRRFILDKQSYHKFHKLSLDSDEFISA